MSLCLGPHKGAARSGGLLFSARNEDEAIGEIILVRQSLISRSQGPANQRTVARPPPALARASKPWAILSQPPVFAFPHAVAAPALPSPRPSQLTHPIPLFL